MSRDARRTAAAPWAATPWAALALAAAACNGEFRFDQPATPDAMIPDAGEDAGAPKRCASDTECAAIGMRCHAATGRCVACLGDADCTGARRRCEPTMHVCVACVGGSDCGLRQRCEAATHLCIDVCGEGNEYCPTPGFVCDEAHTHCAECKTNAHCASSPKGKSCDTATGICVACAGNAACPIDKPICDRRTGNCAACVTSAECPDGMACDPTALECRPLP